MVAPSSRTGNVGDVGNQELDVFASTGTANDARNQASHGGYITGIQMKGGGPKKKLLSQDKVLPPKVNSNWININRLSFIGLWSDGIKEELEVESFTKETLDINSKGGGPKKKKFSWDEEKDGMLRICAEKAREFEGAFKKNLLKLFKNLLFEKNRINFNGTDSALTTRLSLLDKIPQQRKNFIWTDSSLVDLLKFGIEAQTKKERNKSLSYSRLLYEKFVETHPDYNGKEETIRRKFQEILRKTDPEYCLEIQKEFEVEFEAAEMEKINDNLNVPENIGTIKRLLDIGKEHGKKPLYCGLCTQCGKLLFSKNKNPQWKKVESPGLKVLISKVYDKQMEPKNIPYRDGDKLYVCHTCIKSPGILSHVNLRNPASNLIDIPPVLEDITDQTELGLIALLGAYHTVHRRMDPMHRIFQHLQGEVNLLSKKDQEYSKMFGIMCDKKPVNYKKDRFERLKKALSWLRQYNHLYRRLYANCETLFPHYKPEQNPILFKGDKKFLTNKGEELTKALGEEDLGYFLPANNFEGEKDFEEGDFAIGITHPKEDWKELEPKESFKRLTNPGILNSDLEALAFPKLFPGGTGSYDPKNKNVTHRNWCKLLLLNLDPRWRRARFFMFFLVDRFIKMSLLTYNRCVVAPIGETAVKAPTVTDVKENPYTRFGSKVPATVPGSKSYWWNKTQDVYAISQDMGRNPDYFITITTNDNWPEIQRCVYHGADDYCDKCPHEDDQLPAMEYATECSIAFNERWKRLKKEILHNKKGELGNVVRYWFRREYQKRGAVHIHGVVWVEEEKPEGVVRAEMPRGSDQNDPTIEELRAIVNKYQTHNCMESRCFFAGTKRLNKCKYGYPAPLSTEMRPDETGLRKVYIRRHEEDRRIVPYCMSLLLIMRAHCNIQVVSASGWEMYLTKYMTKPEPSARVQYGPAVDKMTNAQRFLQMRVIGAIEANDILLQFAATESNVEVLYLPIDIDPKFKVLKRLKHMPKEEDSTDVFYDSKWEKYLYRPQELELLTYGDFFRQFNYGSSHSKREEDDPDDSEVEETDIMPITSLKDLKGRILFKRKHPIVIRFPFFEPYGDNQEKFCLKLLIEKNPYSIKNIDSILSPGSKTYMDECLKQDLWDKSIVLEFLGDAHQQGHSEFRLREFAKKLVQFNYVEKADAVDFFRKLHETETMFPKCDIGYNVDEDFYGDFPGADLDLKPLNFYKESFNYDQLRIFNNIQEKIRNNQQVLASIMGPAGTGKSHLLTAFCALFKQKSESKTYRSFCILAPTGAAAYLIKGQTIHSFFRFDTQLKSHIWRNSMDEFFIRMCDTILIDEMSMINYDVFDTMEFQLRRFGLFSNKFGGKDVILFGDPAQLPARDMPFFCHELFRKFEIFTLNQIVRQEDPVFAQMLQQVRLANITEEVEKYFRARIEKPVDYDLVIKKDIRILVAHRTVRNGFNEALLDRLPGEEKVFKARDTDLNDKPLSEQLQTRLEELDEKFPTTVRIKQNALVMLNRNIRVHKGLVNGRLARVVGWGENYVTLKSLDSDEEWPVYVMRQTLRDYGEDKYIRHQIPIILGWASTIHKVQGMTLDKAYILLDRSIFESGMAYVALSRVRRITDMRLLDFEPSKIILSDYYRNLIKWFELNDIYSFNRDTSFPMPEWSGSKFDDKDRNPKGLTFAYGPASDEEMPSQGSQRSWDDDIEMLSQESHKSCEEKTEMVCESILSEPSDDLTERCSEILSEILNKNYYNRNINDLEDFVGNHSAFNQNVIQFLRNRHRPINSEFSLPRRYPISPVPQNMRDSFNLAHVPGDGNCFYYSVSMTLFGTETLMPVIRYATLLMMIQNRKYFEKWIQERMGEDFRNHLLGVGTMTSDVPKFRYKYAEMRSNLKFNWAANAEQLATSIAIDRPIRIYIQAGMGYHSICSPSAEHLEKEGIFVQLKEEHFEALIPLNNRPEVFPCKNRNLMWNRNMGLIYPYDYSTDDSTDIDEQ